MKEGIKNIEKIREDIEDLIIELGDLLITKRQEKKINVHKKEGLDIVTDIDLLVERKIIDYIKTHYPDHHVVSEEEDFLKYKSGSTGLNDNGLVWIIDPIDGTINYASGLPFFSISIALQKNGETYLGLIYAPALKELFVALRGGGSYLNNRRIKVSAKNQLEDSVLSFMMTSHYNSNEINYICRIARSLSSKVRGLRLFVSLALELGYIACGKLEGAICIKSRGFSSSAGVLLVQEAGGYVTDIMGRPFNNGSRSLVATNKYIHAELLSIIQGKEVQSDERTNK